MDLTTNGTAIWTDVKATSQKSPLEPEDRLVKSLLDWTWDHSPLLLSVFSC